MSTEKSVTEVITTVQIIDEKGKPQSVDLRVVPVKGMPADASKINLADHTIEIAEPRINM